MKVNWNAEKKETDSLTALIRMKKEIRSLDSQIRKTGNRDAREKLQHRKQILERNFRTVMAVFRRDAALRAAERREAVMEHRSFMRMRSRMSIGLGDGIETAAFRERPF